MFSPGDASPSTSPYSQGITNPLGIRSAPQERRKSWAGTQRGSRTPESPLPLFHSEEKKTKTRSPLSRLKPYMLNGSPTRFGRGTAAGRFLTILNFARFRGKDTKQLAILISLNIAYSTTELLLGLFLGKIELVSDAFHLSFGCCVLILCLMAMVWGREKSDGLFTYGYGRLEVLAAFTNALFLLFLCFSLSVEALHAFMEDESEHKHYLTISAVANLLVNLLGVYFFRHHAKLKMNYDRPQDMNHHAIFLHLLSDSIRSGGVILASWLLAVGVQYAETICLTLVALIVLWLTFPLVRSSGGLLLQMAPAGISETALHKIVMEASSFEGVNEFEDARFWAMVPGAIVGTVRASVKADAEEQKVLGHIHSVFNDVGVTDLTVQINKY